MKQDFTIQEKTASNRIPLLSIIVPVYNTIEYLPKCLNSILDQCDESIEVILVDDGSTDGSEKYCDDIAARYSQVICLHQENHGVSAARNLGLDVARGNYIWFCDSDDTIVPDAVATISIAIEKHCPSMIIFPLETIDDSGNTLGFISAPRKPKSATDGPLQCDNPLYVPAHVFKRAIADSERFDTSLVLFEDRDFFYRLTLKSIDGTFILNEPLYRYLITRPGSAVNSISYEKLASALKAHRHILECEIARGFPNPAFIFYAKNAMSVFYKMLRDNRTKKELDPLSKQMRVFSEYAYLLPTEQRIKYLLAAANPFFLGPLYKAKQNIGRLSSNSNSH